MTRLPRKLVWHRRAPKTTMGLGYSIGSVVLVITDALSAIWVVITNSPGCGWVSHDMKPNISVLAVMTTSGTKSVASAFVCFTCPGLRLQGRACSVPWEIRVLRFLGLSLSQNP